MKGSQLSLNQFGSTLFTKTSNMVGDVVAISFSLFLLKLNLKVEGQLLPPPPFPKDTSRGLTASNINRNTGKEG